MDAALLWPGEERCVMLPSKDGRHQIEYSYRTERGALFECVCKDAEEAHRPVRRLDDAPGAVLIHE